MKFLWIDLETSGLDPANDNILELAWIVTEPDTLETIESGSVVFPHQMPWANVLDYKVLEMHNANGLLLDCTRAWEKLGHYAQDNFDSRSWLLSQTKDTLFYEYMNTRGEREEDIILAGSSPHFDRAFLRRTLPDLDRRLSHRHFDVSVFDRAAAAWTAGEDAAYEETKVHRALADVQRSLRAARHYKALFVGSFERIGAFTHYDSKDTKYELIERLNQIGYIVGDVLG